MFLVLLFKGLYFPLVFFGSLAVAKCAVFGLGLARIKEAPAGLELAYHDRYSKGGYNRCATAVLLSALWLTCPRNRKLFMKSFGFVLFLFCGLAADAQFSDSVTHYVRLSAAGNINRSNRARAFLLNNDARFSIKNKRTTLNTVATWLYGEQGSSLTNNDFTTTADFNFYRDSSKLYYWALANYTASYSLRIRNQIQSGLGLAYNFVNTTNAWLNLSEGVLYETSRLSTNDASLNRYHTARNSLRLSYKFVINKNVNVSGANFFQQAFGNGADHILRLNNSLAVKLNKWISITATINYNQYKRTGAENLLFTYGVVAERFF